MRSRLYVQRGRGLALLHLENRRRQASEEKTLVDIRYTLDCLVVFFHGLYTAYFASRYPHLIHGHTEHLLQ